MYERKIRAIRETRGFSQEFVAQKLGIAQNSYSRIESNQTKLSAEMLEKLAEELGVTPADIMSAEPIVVNTGTNHGMQGINHVEHYYSMQKEMVDKLLAAKDSEIENLKEIINGLMKDKELLMRLVESKHNQ